MRLEPPCGYTGGKRRFAGEIVTHILSHQPRRVFDVGCGSGAVSLELLNRGLSPKQLIMVDAGPWGWFWKAASEGTLDMGRVRGFFHTVMKLPPHEVARFVEEEIAALPPTAETFLVLQAAAFGSTPVWWDGKGWRRGEGNRGYKARAYWQPGPNSSETKPRGTIFTPDKILSRTECAAAGVRGATVVAGNVEDVTLEAPGVAYVDPPYENSSGYGATMSLEKVVRAARVPVYVSEGKKLDGAAASWKLTGLRKGASLNGKSAGVRSGTDEWLSFFTKGDMNGYAQLRGTEVPRRAQDCVRALRARK